MENQMKVSASELAEIIRALPPVKSISENKIVRVLKFIEMNGQEKSELQINLYFEKNIKRDGWDIILPKSHSNPVLDSQASHLDD